MSSLPGWASAPGGYLPSGPVVMGVVNVTPDSFSDGGRFLDPGAAVAHGRRLAAEGAAVLDVGGESTRPGAEPVPAREELRRVLPVVEALAASTASGPAEGRYSGTAEMPAGTSAPHPAMAIDSDPVISIDTTKPEVARAALDAGARIVNDVSAFRGAPEMAGLVAETGAGCCLMHMLGEPRTMQDAPRYDDVVSEVTAFLAERLSHAVAEGVPEERVWLDPGIGFGKTVEHNLELLRRLDEIVALGRPVVVGTSRKSFLGRITGRPVEERLPATIATSVLAYERGARVFRVHDVAEVGEALSVTTATVRAEWPSAGK